MADRECLDDLEAAARQILPQSSVFYIACGSDGQQTLIDNTNAFRRIRLRPRLMRDTSRIDTSSTILGHKVPFPIAIAPTALHHWVHQGGEVLTAKAAESMGTGMVLSMWSGISLEEIASCAPTGLRWLHITPLSNRIIIKQIVNRAEHYGYKAIFVTLDSPTRSKKRTPLIVNKMYRRTPVRYGHFKDTDVPLRTDHDLDIELIDNTITWEFIDWLKSITTLPIVGKGILTAEDAREAVKHGISGILVSNHGGRQLDGVLATIDALPEVVEAVKGTGVEVYLDGGVRMGTDVLKALALGARAVFVGRPILWGLGLDGEKGVKRVIKILHEEFNIAMALTGCRSIEDINTSMVQRQFTCASKL